MEQGDIVTIYHDPLTKKETEGEVKLIKRLRKAKFKNDPEYWTVKFTSDGFVCDRFVGGELITA